jgi:hypothetical protein
MDSLNQVMTPELLKCLFDDRDLTLKHFTWFKTLVQNQEVVRRILGKGDSQWLYYPAAQHRIVKLIDVLSQNSSRQPLYDEVLSRLMPMGANIVNVCDCCEYITKMSQFGLQVCERLFSRSGSDLRQRWTYNEAEVIYRAWVENSSLTGVDNVALKYISTLFGISLHSQVQPATIQSMKKRLHIEYESLFCKLKDLETQRIRLQQKRPREIAALLQRVGEKSDASRRILDHRVPKEFLDSVESIGESEYEFSFSLKDLNSLKRQARGIPPGARLLIVRLNFQQSGTPKFCIHFWTGGDIPNKHAPGTCANRSNLFVYYLGGRLFYLIRDRQFSWKSVHDTVSSLITSLPTSCLVCPKQLKTRLWKPAPCSRECSYTLRSAPLEVRLHNLLIEPASLDLLLTCMYEVAGSQSPLDLLPNCPITKDKLRSVIDSFPPLAKFQDTHNLRQAIHGTDNKGSERELLLSWLCLRFRGLILKARGNFRVPSMPNTLQFLMLNSDHEREHAFNTKRAGKGSGRAAFHGTGVLRLFRILSEGLKVMSGTEFQASGASFGNGIYLAEEQNISLGYAGSTNKSWKNSALKDLRVLLGCEVATDLPPPPGQYHVIADEKSVLVRYIFLIPQGYGAPPRRHVEPAMTSTFTNLRSGGLS